jgi:aminopeptidase
MRHEARLDRLAKIAVHVGLGLKRNQEVVVMAPIEALPLVRQITEHAYRAGASLVSTLFTDEEATLMRFRHATEDSFDKAPDWLFDGMSAAHRDGAAGLAIVGQDPFLLETASQCPLVHVGGLKRSGCWSMTMMHKPFLLPQRT